MKRDVLVMNVGSSSVKYSVFKNNKLVEKSNFERVFTRKEREKTVSKIFERIDVSGIGCVAHRVVHGGSITGAKKVTKNLLVELRKISELAPLHEIPEIEVIEACMKKLNVPQIAVFDTAFHQTMHLKAKAYGLPYKYYLKGIRKYGFHGVSHEYVSRGLKGKVITCHLGNGCSVTAVKDGKSVDTSMGFTPLEGLVMSTRSGSLDPSVIPYMVKHEKISLEKISNLLNKESGLLGVSGKSHDLRDLTKSKNKRSLLAAEMFFYSVAKQIGAFAAAMNGVNTIVFTAGIGQNNADVRKRILGYFGYLGVKLDNAKNKKNSRVISSKNSKVKVMVIPTDEEKAIASQAIKVIEK